MSESQSNKICSSCGGPLNSEGTFRDSYRRFERFKCESCKKPFEIGLDPCIKDEYPQIKTLSIEVISEGAKTSRKFDQDSPVILLCCTNHRCTKPGIYIPIYLQKMSDSHETHQKFYQSCDGFEPSPKWRRKKPCDQSFWITIDMVPKDDESSGTPSKSDDRAS